MILPIRFSLPLVFAVLASSLPPGPAFAQDRALPAVCDALLDLATLPSDGSPPKLRVTGNLCLDSHQIETWFLSHGGWSSELTEDHRYWRLKPPAAPAQTTLILVMPGGEQREVILSPQPSSS